jgi:hypothetical protein
MARAFVATLMLTIAGCGSKSGLVGSSSAGAAGQVAVSGGAGGVGGGGGFSPSGGSGGLGGAGAGGGGTGGAVPTECVQLLQLLPNRVVPQIDESVDDHSPALVTTNPDADQVTVAFARDALSTLTHATFLPWTAWTSDPVLPTFAPEPAVVVEDSFAAGPGAGTFGVACRTHTVNGFQVLPFVPINDNSAGELVGLSIAPSPIYYPRLIVAHDTKHHVAASARGGQLWLHVIEFVYNGDQKYPSTPACANAPIAAGAVRFEDGWLLAHSNSDHPNPEDCEFPSEPATRLEVRKVLTDGGTNVIATLTTEAPIVELEVASHPTGIHVVYSVATDAPSPLWWARVDATTGTVVGPTPVTEPNVDLSDFALASLGSNVALVTHDTRLDVINESGGIVTTLTPALPFSGRVAAIGSPDGMSLVVARSTGDGARHIELSRFDCVSP